MSAQLYHPSTYKNTPYAAVRDIPAASMPTFPDELANLTQWVGGKIEMRRNKQGELEPTKVPYSPATNQKARINDPSTWGSLLQAWAMVQSRRAEFLMLAFVEGGDLVFTDLDDCRDPETGIIDPWALEIIEAQGTFAEPSVSGSGMHTIGCARKPGTRCRNWKHNHGRQIEVYERSRFAAMTGNILPGYDAITDTQDHLNAFYQTHWQDHQQASSSRPAANTPDLDSLEVIERASSASNGAKFRTLYEDGDTSAYGGDDSAADSALCCLIAFYSKDPTVILDIWRSSGLYRDKTDREDYAERTITTALEFVGSAGYDPDYQRPSVAAQLAPRAVTAPPVNDADIDAMGADDLRRGLRAAQAVIADQARELDFINTAYAREQRILAAEEHTATARVAMVGLYKLSAEFQSTPHRHKPTAHGDFHMPLAWIGRNVGMNDQAVGRQLRILFEAGLIDRDVRKAPGGNVTRDFVDLATGEITAETHYADGADQSFIRIPDNLEDMVVRFESYQKPEDAPKAGGARVPACDKHPDHTHLIRRTGSYCEACYLEALRDKEPIPMPLHVTDPLRVKRADEADDTGDPVPSGNDHTVDSPQHLWPTGLTSNLKRVETAGLTSKVTRVDSVFIGASLSTRVEPLRDRVRDTPTGLTSNLKRVQNPDEWRDTDVNQDETAPNTRSCPNCHAQHSGERSWCPACIADDAVEQARIRDRDTYIKNRHPGRESAHHVVHTAKAATEDHQPHDRACASPAADVA